MARAGDVIENPASGETIEFLSVAADTRGESLRWIHSLRPGARVPAEHFHELQEESFEVVEGTATFTIDGIDRRAGEGTQLSVQPGQRHTFRNDTHAPVAVRIEMRPARKTERLFEATFALATQGKANRRGLPNPVWSAVIASETDTRDWIPRIPVWLQKAAITTLAGLGRIAGYDTDSMHERGSDVRDR